MYGDNIEKMVDELLSLFKVFETKVEVPKPLTYLFQEFYCLFVKNRPVRSPFIYGHNKKIGARRANYYTTTSILTHNYRYRFRG